MNYLRVIFLEQFVVSKLPTFNGNDWENFVEYFNPYSFPIFKDASPNNFNRVINLGDIICDSSLVNEVKSNLDNLSIRIDLIDAKRGFLFQLVCKECSGGVRFQNNRIRLVYPVVICQTNKFDLHLIEFTLKVIS